jgi:hypothetical protein
MLRRLGTPVQVEMESVKEYVQQSSNVVSLHTQIQACDMILARMQEMLLGFQVRRMKTVSSSLGWLHVDAPHVHPRTT